MVALHVTITPEQQSHLQQRLEAGEFATASEYVRALIREDQRRTAQDQLEAKLLASLESEATELNDQTLEALRQRMTDKINTRRNAKRKA